IQALGATAGGERESADAVLPTALLDLLFSQADARQLRGRVDDARDGVVIDVWLLPREVLRNGDAFLRRLVRQHRPRDQIADGVAPGHVRLEVFIDLHAAAALVYFDAELFETNARRVRPAADRHQHAVAFKVQRLVF